MGVVQSTVLGLPTAAGPAPSTTSPATPTGTHGSPVTASDIVTTMDWNPGAEDATAALDIELDRMA